jgi:hypothetical protein
MDWFKIPGKIRLGVDGDYSRASRNYAHRCKTSLCSGLDSSSVCQNHPHDGADESSRSRNLIRLKQIISGAEIISPPLTFSPVDLVSSNFGKRLFAFFFRQDNGTETKTIWKGNKL